MTGRALYLLRHGEAANGNDDFKRPLTPKGARDIGHLAAALSGFAPHLALIVCSPAVRTRQTLAALRAAPGLTAHIIFEDGLYNASAGALFETVKALPDQYRSVLMIGHNPGIHGLGMFLATPSQEPDFYRLGRGYAPGTWSAFDCPVARWADMLPGQNRLAAFLSP